MTRDEAINMLMARCERREDDATLKSLAVSEMKLAQETLEGMATLPWFLITEEANASTVANEERLLLPDDFLLEVEDSHLYVQDPNAPTVDPWQQLDKTDLDRLENAYKEEGPSLPEAYAISGANFILRPKPDAIYAVKMQYYARDSWPGPNETNKWLTEVPALLIAKTGAVLAGQYLHNDALMAKFLADELKYLEAMLTKNEERMHVNRDYHMGEGE